MLLKDFYQIKEHQKTGENNHAFKIFLNKDHEVFKGHFPNNPITPGVCMLQIIKELTSSVTHKNIQLVSGSNIKFMAIINPEVTPNLDLIIEIVAENETEIKIKNTTSFGETIALKLSNSYKVIDA
jgi:3-hydroxyacyl-[acyl-carrier-protein] dehydratase